jgi:predicted DNA-binding transcriptional regulator AlpA
MTEQLTSIEVADLLKLHPMTVNASRRTGVLLGREAPKFKKIGKTVRYNKSDIEAWLGEDK